MTHLSVMAFSGKEPFLSVGPEALSISECSGNEVKSYILWIFAFFKLGPLSVSAFQMASVLP